MKLKYVIAPLALAAAVLTGCQEAEEYRPVIYMTDAQAVPSKTVTIDETPAGTTISVSASEAVMKDTHISLELRPDLIEEYNLRYGKNYAALPDDSYVFDNDQVVISAGFTASSPVNLTIKSIDDFKEGTTYCMPVSIKTTDGDMPVLEPSRTVFVVLKTPVISKAMFLGGSNIYDVPKFQEDASLSSIAQLTIECRVYMNGFVYADPKISSIIGIEGECMVRFGDTKVPSEVIQICHGNYQPAAMATPLTTGKWYHIAAVWTGTSWDIYIDGKFAAGSPTAGEALDLTVKGNGSFHMGASYGRGRPMNGYIAEARVWTRALSINEIANNMNYVDPASKGLLAYWRMNAWEPNTEKGRGNIVRDLTGHGYDAWGDSSNPTMMDTRWM